MIYERVDRTTIFHTVRYTEGLKDDSEPCLNFKSRLLTSFCRLAQFSPRRKFTELPFADEKFKLVSQCRSHRRPRPRNPYFTSPVLSSAGSSSHFHVAACFVPPSYLCNGCTTGHGSRQRNVFQAHFSRPPDAGSSLFEDSCPVQTQLKFSRKKWQSSVPFQIAIVVAINNDIHPTSFLSYYLSMPCCSTKPNINYKF